MTQRVRLASRGLVRVRMDTTANEERRALMRSMRRAAMTISVLVLALLPATAAVSPEAASAPDVPVAITQPVGNIARVLGRQSATPLVPEAGMILLVGSCLMGLGVIVRRSTRV